MLLRPGLGIERQFLFGTTLFPKIIVIVAWTLSSNGEVAVMQILKLDCKRERWCWIGMERLYQRIAVGDVADSLIKTFLISYYYKSNLGTIACPSKGI